MLVTFIIYANLNTVFSDENRILFKLSNKSFTSFDYEKRKEYLLFVGDNLGLSKDEIINDFISVSLFKEYYIKSGKNIKLNNKVNEIFDDILDKKKINVSSSNIDKKNILINLENDLIRKLILENFLNDNKNEILNSENEVDLIYNFKIKYINVYENDLNNYKQEFNSKKFKNINELEGFLNNKNISFFIKEKEIEKINRINKELISKINDNDNFFIKKNNNLISFISIEKNFETHDGLTANIFSIKSLNKLNSNDLKCDNLKNNDTYSLTKSEYEFVKLNQRIRANLININDYIEVINENIFNYIILCGIKFNMEILKNISLNKKINTRVDYIEKEFIKKYSKKFDLIRLNE